MLKSKLRLLGMSALVGAGLVASGPVNAANFTIGSVDVQVDTTASVGVSVRVADRETDLLPWVNGGPGETLREVYLGENNMGSIANLNAACSLNGTVCMAETATRANSNYDSSINADDGRLNFDSGDLTAGTLKIVTDIEADFGMARGFARVRGFYDAVLDSDSSFERSGINEDGEAEAIMHIDLLDAYIDVDTDIADMPVLVRVGKQVINWGESTFVLGGNSVFSPIDVGAIRRPGAEIKEALLPVEAIYVSASPTDALTVEAYIGGHDEFIIDVGGTPFAGSDAFNKGSKGNGNGFFIGGAPSSGAGRINCNPAGDGTAAGGTNGIGAWGTAISNFAQAAYLAENGATCDNSAIDYLYKLGSSDLGNFGGSIPEQQRLAYDDLYFIERGFDEEEDDFDDVGLALRYYSEALNSTEFGLYYQKVNSRIPYASIRSLGPVAGWTTVGTTTDQTNRIAGTMGCMVAGAAGSAVNQPFKDFTIDDPEGIFDSALATTINGTDLSAAVAALGADAANQAFFDDDMSETTAGTLGRYQQMLCKGHALNMAGGNATVAGTAVLAQTGSMNLAIGFPLELVAEFPEVETIGASFATTLLGWGVQGEIAYREEMPVSLDSNSTTIAGVVSGCAFTNYGAGGDAVIAGVYGVAVPINAFFTSLSTFNAEYGTNCTNGEHLNSGYALEEVYNWDIGTTATYTRSNPIVSALGADLGVLLTEFAGVHAPDFEDHGFVGENDRLRPTGVCTSGSDLALRGLFGLDERSPSECRPTRSAWGYVLLAQLQYNNVFGTPVSLTPRVVYSAGAEGFALRPAAGWTEDQSTLGLSVTAAYQSNLTASLSYTDYQGDVLYNPNIDRDTVSLSVVYGF